MYVPPNPIGLIDRWALASQQGSRRNAMIAATALTQRRAERDEVEEFLARVDGGTPGLSGPAHPDLTRDLRSAGDSAHHRPTHRTAHG